MSGPGQNPLQRRLGRFLDPRAQIDRITEQRHVPGVGGGDGGGGRGFGWLRRTPPRTPIRPVDELPPDPEERWGEMVIDRETGRVYISMFDSVSGGSVWEEVNPPPLGVMIGPPTDFSGASAVNADGVFTGAYDDYRVMVTLTAISNAVAQNLRMQMRAGGINATGVSDYAYDRYGVSAGAANLQSDAAEASTVWGVNGANATGLAATFDVYSPALASPTRITGVSTSIGGTPRAAGHGGYHAQAVAYDGFRLFPDSGTISGTMRIYGYGK